MTLFASRDVSISFRLHNLIQNNILLNHIIQLFHSNNEYFTAVLVEERLDAFFCNVQTNH